MQPWGRLIKEAFPFYGVNGDPYTPHTHNASKESWSITVILYCLTPTYTHPSMHLVFGKELPYAVPTYTWVQPNLFCEVPRRNVATHTHILYVQSKAF